MSRKLHALADSGGNFRANRSRIRQVSAVPCRFLPRACTRHLLAHTPRQSPPCGVRADGAHGCPQAPEAGDVVAAGGVWACVFPPHFSPFGNPLSGSPLFKRTTPKGENRRGTTHGGFHGKRRESGRRAVLFPGAVFPAALRVPATTPPQMPPLRRPLDMAHTREDRCHPDLKMFIFC